MDKVFYYPEWTQILNRLIPNIPSTGSFELYEISKECDKSFEDLFTEGLANVEETYLQITNGLIANDLARLTQGHKIELTDIGKKMKKSKNWESYILFVQLEENAKRSDLWTKAYWLKYEWVKVLLTVITTIGITLLTQWLSKKLGL